MLYYYDCLVNNFRSVNFHKTTFLMWHIFCEYKPCGLELNMFVVIDDALYFLSPDLHEVLGGCIK